MNCRHCGRGRGHRSGCTATRPAAPKPKVVPAPEPNQAPRRPCRHCKDNPEGFGCRGMCWKCYKDPKVRTLYPGCKYRPSGPEPTEAELEGMIAEQMANLPKWWGRDAG